MISIVKYARKTNPSNLIKLGKLIDNIRIATYYWHPD
jgi:hypothetical protein